MKDDIKMEGTVWADDDDKEDNEQSSSKKHQARNALNFPATKYPTERLGDLECLECGKRFMNLQNLNSHHIVHTGEKPFECYHCGVRLRYHKSLKRHMRLHIGDKNICCEDPDCNEKFKTKNQLDIHMRQHTDQKRRYTCPLCDKSFFQKKILRQHRKIHGERNYKCEVCGRAFTENSRLREHMKVHTGKMWIRMKMLVRWLSFGFFFVVSDEKPFLCSECGKNFRTKFSLDLHLKRHNNEVSTTLQCLRVTVCKN
jgi:KRAB domain-containing zinc finger protein